MNFFFIVRNLLFDALGESKDLLYAVCPRKQIMRWKLTCGKFMRESPWD